MRRGVTSFLLAAFMTMAGLAGASAAARVAVFYGTRSVLIVTEKGDCDTAYRYAVSVTGGKVRNAGDSGFDLGGTVTADGAVTVSIRRGDRAATGSGRLAEQTGEGTWHGVGAHGACAGRWEAERR